MIEDDGAVLSPREVAFLSILDLIKQGRVHPMLGLARFDRVVWDSLIAKEMITPPSGEPTEMGQVLLRLLGEAVT